MKQLQQLSTRRLEALTDGVFAIAMTLLVLDLVVPVGTQVNNSAQLWETLAPLANNFISFTISFIILAIMWAVHTRQFENIKRMDSRVVNYNILRLFLVVLLPFTTSLIGEYNTVTLAIVLYPLNLLALAVVTYFQGLYLAKRPSYFREFNKEAVKAGNQRSLAFLLTAVVVVVGSLIFGQIAYFGFFLSPVITRLLAKRP